MNDSPLEKKELRKSFHPRRWELGIRMVTQAAALSPVSIRCSEVSLYLAAGKRTGHEPSRDGRSYQIGRHAALLADPTEGEVEQISAEHRTASSVTSLLSRQPAGWHLLIEPR